MHKHGLKARPKCDTPTFLCSLLQASSAAALSLLAARDPVVSDTLRYLGALPLLVDLLNSSHLTVTEAARCCLLSLKHNNPRNASEILACLRSNQDLCKVRPSTTAQRMCAVHAFCTTVAVNQNRPVGYCCPPNEHLLTSCLVTSQNAARLVLQCGTDVGPTVRDLLASSSQRTSMLRHNPCLAQHRTPFHLLTCSPPCCS